MKKLIVLVLVVAANTGLQAQFISWNENNGGSVPGPSGVAGVVAAANWNNSINGMSLVDNTGASTSASFSITGSYGAWGIAPISAGPDGDGTYNRTMLDGYANTASGIGPEQFAITGIPYATYDMLVYFSSDTAGRAGAINDANAGITYDFTTVGQPEISGNTALLIQSMDTTGANPTADYVEFLNVSGSSDTLTLNIPNGGGIAGFQIVATPEPGTVALTLLGGLAILVVERRRKTKI